MDEKGKSRETALRGEPLLLEHRIVSEPARAVNEMIEGRVVIQRKVYARSEMTNGHLSCDSEFLFLDSSPFGNVDVLPKRFGTY